MKRKMITNKRFILQRGDIKKVERPENIPTKYSTYYDYFNEDGTPKRKKEDGGNDKV